MRTAGLPARVMTGRERVSDRRRRRAVTTAAGLAASVALVVIFDTLDPYAYLGVVGAAGVLVAVGCGLVAGPLSGSVVGAGGGVVLALYLRGHDPAPALGGVPQVVAFAL